MKTPSPEKQLAGFIAKFAPEIAKLIRGARKKMRERLPRALERAISPIDAKGVHRLIIKSVSAKRRPRRPAVAAKK